MKQKQISHLFRTLGASFRRCAVRFPVTVAFTFALTVYLCHLVATEGKAADDKLLMTTGYYLSVGTLLSLSLHLWAEEVKRRGMRIGVQVAAHLLLMADALFLYLHTMGARMIDIGIAHGAGILAIGLSVFFLPFYRERDDIPAWNFAQYALGTLALTVIVGAVMSGGISLLALSLHQLFGVDVSYKCYLYILIMCSVWLPLLMFLGLLPEGERKHDRVPQPTAFLHNILHYLFLPLAGLYLLVLYIYAGTIIARWELPDGWVSWLVTALMAGVIGIEGGLYPSRVKSHKPMDERIARWLPLLTLPLLVLMTVGIGRRFLDYGITLNRLYLATLNAWFYFVCIGLAVGKARRISWIPISFSLVFLLTSVLPVNYAGITRSVLREDVKEALGDKRNLSEAQYEAWLQSLPQAKARAVEDKLHYLQDWFGKESIQDLVKDGVSYRRVMAEEEPGTESLDFEQTGNVTTDIPQGYSRLTFFQYNGRLRNDTPVLSVPLSQTGDSLRLPIDSLRRWEERDRLPLLRTVGGNAFCLVHYHIFIDKKECEMTADISGCLFHNNEINP